uniref:Uncharacterized protein n=1 Tax=Tetradesmus obliquus TaxID=3088 RepID=A0A383VHI3_TETOB|eukprot:jgi/Sobl393_1/17457/SZX64269.1
MMSATAARRRQRLVFCLLAALWCSSSAAQPSENPLDFLLISPGVSEAFMDGVKQAKPATTCYVTIELNCPRGRVQCN